MATLSLSQVLLFGEATPIQIRHSLRPRATAQAEGALLYSVIGLPGIQYPLHQAALLQQLKGEGGERERERMCTGTSGLSINYIEQGLLYPSMAPT